MRLAGDGVFKASLGYIVSLDETMSEKQIKKKKVTWAQERVPELDVVAQPLNPAHPRRQKQMVLQVRGQSGPPCECQLIKATL